MESFYQVYSMLIEFYDAPLSWFLSEIIEIAVFNNNNNIWFKHQYLEKNIFNQRCYTSLTFKILAYKLYQFI